MRAGGTPQTASPNPGKQMAPAQAPLRIQNQVSEGHPRDSARETRDMVSNHCVTEKPPPKPPQLKELKYGPTKYST